LAVPERWFTLTLIRLRDAPLLQIRHDGQINSLLFIRSMSRLSAKNIYLSFFGKT